MPEHHTISVDPPLTDRALLELKTRLGSIECSLEPGDCLAASQTTFAPRGTVAAIVRPRNETEVVKTVGVLSDLRLRFHCRSGKSNWGYGSRTPSNSHSVLLSLERLNRLEVLNAEIGLIEIGPGVSTRELAEFLSTTLPQFSVSGPASTGDASVVGNLLTRGLGMGVDGQRAKYLRSVRAVIPAFGLIDTADGHPESTPLGPDPTSLFFQTTLGVVTAARIQLHRPLGFTWRFETTFDATVLDDSLCAVRHLLRRHDRAIVSIHSYDARRKLRTGRAQERWMLIMRYETNRQWEGYATAAKMSRDFGLSWLRQSSPIQFGDGSMEQVYEPRRKGAPPRNPDTDGIGLLFANASLPYEPSSIIRALQEIQLILDRNGVTTSMSIRAFDANYVFLIAPIIFSKGDLNAANSAMTACEEIHDAFRPYRLSTLQDLPSSAMLDALKRSCDPHGLLW